MNKSKFNKQTNRNPFKKNNDRDNKKTNNKGNKKSNELKDYAKVGKSLNLKFEIPKYVKLIKEYNGDEDSIIKNIPFILLGLASLVLKHRDIVKPLIKDYREELKKPQTEFLQRLYTVIVLFLKRLESLYKTDTLEFLATSLGLIKIITVEIPYILTKANDFAKINILSLTHTLAETANQVQKIFIKIPDNEEEQTKKQKDFINRIEKLEQMAVKATKIISDKISKLEEKLN